MEKPALYQVTTHHADGSASRDVVPASLAQYAYAQALRKAWRAKAGDLVTLHPYGVTLPNAPAPVERMYSL